MKIIPFTLFSILVFSFCAPKEYDRLSFQKTEVQADGNISEWSNPLKYFDPKSKLNFSITNDRKNLYICIKAGDDQSQMKILRGGMDFSIDTAAKNAYPVSVTFPLSGMERMKKHVSKEEGSSEQSDISRKEAMIENCKIMKLSGFLTPLPSDNVPITNAYGVTAALSIDKHDVMVYELIVPFKTFYKEELAPSDSNKIFSYQIKVKGIVFEQHDASRSSDGSRGGGSRGGGGGMGGGMPGGGGGRQGGGTVANPLAETDVVHFKAKFSYK